MRRPVADSHCVNLAQLIFAGDHDNFGGPLNECPDFCNLGGAQYNPFL